MTKKKMLKMIKQNMFLEKNHTQIVSPGKKKLIRPRKLKHE